MHSLLLRKALPFALTFVLGSLAGGLFKSFGHGAETAAPARPYFYGYRDGRSCRMRSRYLVAETKPLTILFKPDARWPRTLEDSARVQVTFGADGKVQNVEPAEGSQPGSCRGTTPYKWEAVEKAARGIQFEPETVNSVPVTVTREVEIRFMPE